jgi:nucleoside-diphosphate-sugar epimerase
MEQNMTGKRYLVTGAAGFIAARTTEMLLESGAEVVGIDNLNDYYDVRVKEHRLAALQARPGFTFHRMDIEDRAAVNRLFDGEPFDAVLNLAARAGVRYSMENPFVYLTTNANGTLHLLEAMRHGGCRKFVLASTSSLYAGLPTPFVETLPVNTPISPYAASKKAAEVMTYTYHKQFDIDATIVRYFTVYGPAGRPDMSPFRFIKWIAEGTPITVFGDGTQSRDFTYVDDIARGTIAALKPVGYEIVNLGGGRRPRMLNEMIALLEQLLGRSAVIDRKPFHSADMLETSADIGKARSLLEWEPQIDLEEGLAKSVEWYLQNQSWLRDVAV